MEYKVYPEETKKLVAIDFVGDQYYDSSKAAVAEAINLIRKKNWHSILIDMTASKLKFDIIETLDIIKQVKAMGATHTDCFAGVLGDKEVNLDHIKFAEIASQNRFYVMKLFKKRDEACSWLMDISSRINSK